MDSDEWYRPCSTSGDSAAAQRLCSNCKMLSKQLAILVWGGGGGRGETLWEKDRVSPTSGAALRVLGDKGHLARPPGALDCSPDRLPSSPAPPHL